MKPADILRDKVQPLIERPARKLEIQKLIDQLNNLKNSRCSIFISDISIQRRQSGHHGIERGDTAPFARSWGSHSAEEYDYYVLRVSTHGTN
jgi:hypothetical protein